MRVLLAPLLAAVFTAAASSQTAPAAQIARPRRLWSTRGSRRSIGIPPASPMRARAPWGPGRPASWRSFASTSRLSISLIRQPDLAIFFRRTPGTTRTRQVMYSGNELDTLRVLARRHGRVRPADLCPDDDLRRDPGVQQRDALVETCRHVPPGPHGRGHRRRAVGTSRRSFLVHDPGGRRAFARSVRRRRPHRAGARGAGACQPAVCLSARAGQGRVGAGLVRGVAGLPAVGGAVRGRARRCARSSCFATTPRC